MLPSPRTKNGTFWDKDGEFWFCRSHIHLQTKRYRPVCETCTYAKCPGRRPPPVEKIAMGVGNIAGIRKLELWPSCVWEPCDRMKRKNSKYCSRACSNKNARARHAARKG